MSRAWKLVQDLEQRIEELPLEELKRAKETFLLRAQLTAPKFAKLIIKRVHQIEREIEKRQQIKD